ncbi:hypothetical protein PUNSTDRAFT_43429 [Punctularia strigosozonata HHB-11173 SS5]|uniref:uncharacterized protein n=1 Tax=Punctularia strigosozonata (strain HHB-11173) TaxID=741275 RepID=UPI0004417645|nr:uncharacterized protein PUNSTDRAFT_43429 [Punctularia strigosozonata HHB-11173 SS5]EIN10558.1 hypothetical protein PUNSTDRAFT_43429 [Punctularia strigosozonata HHB-11173 SS5]
MSTSATSLSPLGMDQESQLAGLPSPGYGRGAVVGRDDSDEEEFVYPGGEDITSGMDGTDADKQPSKVASAPGAEEEEFVYPITETETGIHTEGRTSSPSAEEYPVPPPQETSLVHPHPTLAQLEALYTAASSGDLHLFQNVFRNTLESANLEPFTLANDASSRTGLNSLHAAASRGHLAIVKWLVEECGAMPDLEDKEGETAVHKAALNGHLPVIAYLLPEKADVHAQDADVNAASKGHLPVVLYLLTKQSADPLVRNNWGETAFDVAAAVFEIYICEVLLKAESERWRGTTVPYNPLRVHTTVPLVLYENQRLDVRFKTLAISGGVPKFSASGLGRRGRRAPFELKLPVRDEETGKKYVGAWRSDVQLPSRHDPWILPAPIHHDGPVQDSAERSHFWLSDWTLDVTHPGVDAEEGWQYARSFDDPEDQWAAEPPPPLQRLLSGSGAMTAGLGTPTARSNSGSGTSTPHSHKWVRRRRWVRVMRRRLDIPPMPFLQPDGNMYHLAEDGTLIPHFQEDDYHTGGADGQELGSMPASALGLANDYVARARYLAGTPHPDADGSASALEARRAIAKLERATTELRQGILGDSDAERRTQGEVLLNAYNRELQRRRLAAGAQGLLISGHVFQYGGSFLAAEDDAEEDDDSDEEFHYPGASPVETPRAGPRASSSGNSDYFSSRIPGTYSRSASESDDPAMGSSNASSYARRMGA